MSVNSSPARYHAVAIALHWAIALLIAANLAVGFFMEGLPPPQKRLIIGLHISSGISVLVLSVVRVCWRLSRPPPAFPVGLRWWEVKLAHAAHFSLYFLMIAMPVTGWAFLSAHPARPEGGPLIWGLVRWPIMGPISRLSDPFQKHLHDLLVETHSAGAWIMIALLVLHVGGALKHQLLDRQPELQRMGIGKRQRPLS